MSDTNLSPIKAKYLALPTRHRLMALGLFAAVSVLVFELAWYRGIEEQQKELKQQISKIKKERQSLDSSIQQRNLELLGHSRSTRSGRVIALREQEQVLDQNLAEYAQLVSPRQMPELLRSFFLNSKKLTLQSLTKLPVKSAFSHRVKILDKSEEKAAKALEFYRHDFSVTLSGGYFELSESLQALEKLNLKIYWDSIEYQVVDYPKAEITLIVYTYSYDKNWIGA